jgi:hypothetical protein
MNLDLNAIMKWLSSLNELSGVPLTFILCLASAVGVRLFRWIRNELLPAITIMLGPIFLPFISDYNASSAMTPRVFWCRTVGIGFVVGTAAWLTYHYGIRPLKKKYLGDNGSPADEGVKGALNAMLDDKPKNDKP